ncbi:alpha/beta fold hydrolase [Noviherbaspirillum sp. Root189]|uniref:alpha/beta fold hydrolase n=1 Tax=Noviherbaspirillum sp. Root189 TaxID=1736487 RepID=UPI001F47CA9C|nr:alpha/beta fold hydrolase [Noviherbaspirillum sp. Root189]
MTEEQARREIARLDARAAKQRVVWQGRDVVWRRFGDGPPLVLIHGGHGSWLHWIRNIEVLAQRHTLWLPDLPGFGDSDELDLAAHALDRMQHLTDALAGSLDSLVGEDTQIDLAGFSFGGLAAAHLAALRGGIRRMALLGPAGHGGTRRQPVAMADWRLPDRDAMRAALRHNLAALMLHHPLVDDALAITVHEQCCIQTRFRSKAISRSASLKSTLDRYSYPLLLIWGEHDVTGTPEELVQQLAEGHPGRDWCVVPNAGHWVQYERSDDINRLLLSWFGDGAAVAAMPVG